MKLFKQMLVLFMFIALVLSVGCTKDVDGIKVGILQTATHSALDDAREGFKAKIGTELNGEKVTYVEKNPEGDSQSMNTQAVDLVRTCDIVLGIGTPAATALQTAREAEQVDVVILFTAVTDPVSQGLIEANDKITDITGTNDMNPVSDQIDLLLELDPTIKKIACIYNVSEPNSAIQSRMAQTQATTKNIQFVEYTVSDVSEITATASRAVQDGCDAFYLPTDNLIASNMPAISSVAVDAKVPIMTGESGMLEAGGTITYSINYYALGELTGEMAVKILSGTSASDVHSTSVDVNGLEIVVNEANLEAIGMELPQSIKDRLSE